MNSLIIRADATAQIGTGHVMRCLALAQAWQDQGGSVRFVCADLPAGLEALVVADEIAVARIVATPGSAADARQVVQEAETASTAWVVVDGYQFDYAYQERLKAAGLKLLVIDDYGHAERYVADLVLNQNVYANESYYSRRAANTRLLLGPRYALLRREFHEWREWQRKPGHKRAGNVLVTLGGADPQNVTARVVEALAALPDLTAEVVVGAGNPHSEALLSGNQPPHVRIRHSVTNMPELMAWADVAISAAGSTTLELAFMQLPSLLLVLADNQAPVAEGLEWLGVAHTLGHHPAATPQLIAEALRGFISDTSAQVAMADRGRALVDGLGGQRVVRALRGALLELRPATLGDARLLWEWANDREARAVSLNPEPIAWESHLRWLRTKLAAPDAVLFIASMAGEGPVGTARFDLSASGSKAVISVNVAPAKRHKGLGSLVIERACRELLQGHAIALVSAYVKPDNKPSVGAFLKAGFARAEDRIVQGQRVWQYVYAAQSNSEGMDHG